MQQLTNQVNQEKESKAQIIISGNEIREFEKMLEEFPHSVSKQIIAFVNKCQSKRNQEVQDAELEKRRNEMWNDMTNLIQKQEKELKQLRYLQESMNEPACYEKHPATDNDLDEAVVQVV